MAPRLPDLAKRSLKTALDDLGHVMERVHTHALKERMSPDAFRATVAGLGFSSMREFCDRTGLPESTIESWLRFGLSHDAAQLLNALMSYRNRVKEAIEAADRATNAGVADFFEERQLP
ncbi:hypothetical protein [Chelatococcus composti]|jgi:hypothetical protein|uniref:Uncharacterized protein n=1 Tax=Chelatococcus composti TaxID=1743235 RepID=A0A841KDA6_9HYPH|nr:hypothetical protein [Chelatococcus composti]MBB6167433.1 hypothetical protein [Chelatococcus composti]MBS7735638.1 hypothetical protein [Chelatococcus composti]GGG31898.1 hypothetical protein GCM10008026_10520 [Chelatococcus composti]